MHWAMKYIEALAALPKFPPAHEHAAREMLAGVLGTILEGAEKPEELGARLVLEMIEFDTWPGPATFFQRARRLRFGDPEYNLADVPHLSQYLPASGFECTRCNGWGYVMIDGTYGRCDCEAGRELAPAFLDQLNSRTEKVRGPRELTPAPANLPATRPITIVDIREAERLRKLQKSSENGGK